MGNDLTIAMLQEALDTNRFPFDHAKIATQMLAALQREAEYRSIFRGCVEIIGFHNGGDDEKIEAIRRTLLQAPHIKENENG
jgi:hypothetical protein